MVQTMGHRFHVTVEEIQHDYKQAGLSFIYLGLTGDDTFWSLAS